MLRKEDAFTLIEMMFVILIISTLLLIAVPQMTKSNAVVEKKSCEATIDLLQSQVAAFEMENGAAPAFLSELETEGYVDTVECPGGKELELTSDGKVEEKTTNP
jgi:competence protein ComGC